MRTPVALFAAVSVVAALLPVTGRAQTTLYNRTDRDLFVAIAAYKPSGQVHALDDFHPGWVESRGWFKVNRFGGSAQIPYARDPYGTVTTYIFVKDDQGRKLGRYPQESRSFPVHVANAFNFRWDYPYNSNSSDPWAAGTLQAEARKRNLVVERFALLQDNGFGTGSSIDLSYDNLGWNGAESRSDPGSEGELEVEDSQVTARKYKGQADAGARRIGQIVGRFIQEFTPIAGQVPEGLEVLADARALAALVEKVSAARTEAEARKRVRQVARAWDDLRRRLERASGGQWGPRSRPLLQITDVLRDLEHRL